MDPVGVNSIETAALGRPFQLGMLYDCRRDALVPGIRLWSKEQLEQNISTKPQINTVFTVTASDSIDEKSRLLNIDGHLSLSLLGGLINLSGAAKYLKDTKKSFSQQRLTLHYHSTTKFEELTINHSGEMAHYDDGVATHVVTAVLYGADACFVFDREVSADEDKREIYGEVNAVFGKLKCISGGASMNLNDNQRNAGQKFTCTFYGDFQLPSNPATFEDAMKVFQDLPKLLGENKDLAVPLRVWLYPIDKLFSRVVKFQHEISTGLVSEIESVIEGLSTTEMKCNDLLTDTSALTFTVFHDKINTMKKNCYQCRLSLMKKLGSLLPKIRGKFIEDTALIDLLQDHEKSPFERNTLDQWMKEKEEEAVIIKSVLTQLNESEVKVENKLKSQMDLKVNLLVNYTFTSLNWPDVLLSKQKIYLSPLIKGKNEEKSYEPEHNIWLMPNIQNTMKNNLRLFIDLIDLCDTESVKFIVSSKHHEKHPGSCIMLYENGCNEAVCFTPPSKPDSPAIKEIRNSRVVLKVSPACPATEELTILYKTKEEKDWTSETVSEKQDTVTLTDLRPDTEYQIKCTAVGKLNYTVDSDVTRLTVINQNLIKAKESVIEDLRWAENKCSSLLENSRETPFSALYRKIQHMLKNCQIYRQEFSDGVKSIIQSVKACEKELCALEDFLQAHDESPFNEKSLKEWITVRETELNTVNELHQQLVDLRAETNRSLDSYLSDIQVENVFSYTFTSLELPDELLNEQNHHMNPQMMRNPLKKPDAVSLEDWLTGRVREKMRENLKIFQELMMSHSSQSTKFIISIKDHGQHPGSCIMLYENGSNEAVCFTHPSKPDSPVIKNIRYRQVVLKVSPACAATEELKILYKTKEGKDWTSQSVSEKQDTVTLTDLRSDTEYQIKCAAVGKLNYTTESDVTTVITKNKMDLLNRSILIEDGNPARYRLQTTANQTESYRKMTFGERNKTRPHKTILLAGETGTGKTTLINAMVNYMLGVEKKDKVWFEITEDQRDRYSVHSHTSIITVYGVYLQESQTDLTIIDTPGYGDTRGIELDKKINTGLHSLTKSTEGIKEIDAVCLVINAHQNRLSDRQTYIFDAVQSLFGRDIADNIVLLFTHSTGAPPRNALTAVKEAKVKCAVDEQKQPVFFLFDNCQSDAHDEEYEIIQELSWKLSFRGMTGFFKFHDNVKPKSLEMTRKTTK